MRPHQRYTGRRRRNESTSDSRLSRIVWCEGVYGNNGPMKAAPATRSGAIRASSSAYWAPFERLTSTARSVALASITATQSRANSVAP